MAARAAAGNGAHNLAYLTSVTRVCERERERERVYMRECSKVLGAAGEDDEPASPADKAGHSTLFSKRMGWGFESTAQARQVEREFVRERERVLICPATQALQTPGAALDADTSADGTARPSLLPSPSVVQATA